MRVKVKNFILKVTPMTKYDYNIKFNKEPQHLENKWKNGYYCNWNGYKFWIDEQRFNDLFEIDDIFCK